MTREGLGVDGEAWLCCRLCKARIQELSGGDLSGVEAAVERALENYVQEVQRNCHHPEPTQPEKLRLVT